VWFSYVPVSISNTNAESLQKEGRGKKKRQKSIHPRNVTFSPHLQEHFKHGWSLYRQVGCVPSTSSKGAHKQNQLPIETSIKALMSKQMVLWLGK
jgi:hypothetical protein